jgi:hypothetical protein
MLNNLVMSKPNFTPEEREEYNRWCNELGVSSRWDIDKPENREFMEKYDQVQFAIATGSTEPKAVDHVDFEPTIREKMVDFVSHVLKLKK